MNSSRKHKLKHSRHCGKDEPSLLNLVLKDESMQVTEVLYQVPFGKSDHDVITFQFNCYLDYLKQIRPEEENGYEGILDRYRRISNRQTSSNDFQKEARTAPQLDHIHTSRGRRRISLEIEIHQSIE